MRSPANRFAFTASVMALALGSTAAWAQTADQVPNTTAHTDTGTETPPAPTSQSADPNSRLGVTASSGDAPDGQDIIVRGIRASLEKAAQIKRDNLNVVDSIVADDIGKFPDRTVAAALQRVPGVQVTVGDNNEIVNPIIRGLPDVLTLLDGREIFTGTGRGFSYQDLPAEALAGADVYKSSSAELIDDLFGGAFSNIGPTGTCRDYLVNPPGFFDPGGARVRTCVPHRASPPPAMAASPARRRISTARRSM